MRGEGKREETYKQVRDEACAQLSDTFVRGVRCLQRRQCQLRNISDCTKLNETHVHCGMNIQSQPDVTEVAGDNSARIQPALGSG